MNKKIMIISFVLLLFLCGCEKKQEKTDTSPYRSYDALENHRVELCKEDDICMGPAMVEFISFSYDTKNQKIKDIVETINNQVDKDYKKTINSKLKDGEQCKNEKSGHLYQFAVSDTLHVYEDSKYVILGLSRAEFDFCSSSTTKSKYYQADVKIFDLKENKVISQKEFKKKESITDEMVRTAIDKKIAEYVANNSFKNVPNPTVDYNDVVLFYDGEFGLQASIKINELGVYFSIPISFKEDQS